MKVKIRDLLCAGLLLISSLSHASSVDEFAGDKTSSVAITAHLKYGARGELSLVYEDRQIATLSIYGSSPTSVSWDVSHRFSNCDHFDTIDQQLSVRKNGRPVVVVSFSCKESLN